MELHIATKTNAIIKIEERLKKMTLGYKLIFSEDRKTPAIIDGSKEYHGIDKMNTYLDQLDREKEQWYYCDC